jgi:hypothetical protein
MILYGDTRSGNCYKCQLTAAMVERIQAAPGFAAMHV